MIRTPASIDCSQITDEQIGACSKVYEGSTPVYMVVSASDTTVEYKVRWSKAHGFTCTCKAGQFANLCWHIKASVACEREVKAATAELEAAIAVQKVMSDPSTIKAAEIAREAPEKVKRNRATAPYQSKAFSLMR